MVCATCFNSFSFRKQALVTEYFEIDSDKGNVVTQLLDEIDLFSLRFRVEYHKLVKFNKFLNRFQQVCRYKFSRTAISDI